MKSLIKPPIQLLLWMAGLSFIAWSAWHLNQLRLLSETDIRAPVVRVDIPDTQLFDRTAIGHYRQMLQAPLFWAERAVPRPPPPPPVPVVAAPAPIVVQPAPEPISPPSGRLVGIIDLGERRYGLVRGDAKQLSLHVNDQWDGWTVEAVEKDKLLLVAGLQRHEVKLISDFVLPVENQQMAHARRAQQQREAAQLRQQQIREAAQQINNGSIPSLQPFELDNGDAITETMTIREALEARQRLMAERWGNAQASSMNGHNRQGQ